MSLTPKQKNILDFITQFIHERGASPTFEEIRDHFNFKSLGSVHDYVNYLKKAGMLRSNSSAARSLELVEQSEPNELIPLLGRVAAGSPLEVAQNHEEHLSVPQSLIPRGKCFALQVEGSSMIEDGIFDGDHVVLKAQKNAQNGQTVVALVDGGATIKKYYKKENSIELHPANSALKPIVVEDGQEFSIEGILVALMRSY